MAKKRTEDLEQAMVSAFVPGIYIGWRDSSEFVAGLEAVKTKIVGLIDSGAAARAVTLLETFLAGCYEKTEEVDASDGSFGQLVEDLFVVWIRARQAAGADPAETAAKLQAWMEDDDWGYCARLEKEAVKVMNRAGLTAFETAVRTKAHGEQKGSYAQRRNVGILKAIHEARRDIDGYAALCEQDGGASPSDCEVLAKICLSRRKPEEALRWVRHGITQQETAPGARESAWNLPGLEREILKKLGRSSDALITAWGEYERAPMMHSYTELMKFVPDGERAAWHTKALEAAERGDLSSRIELLVGTKERGRLAECIEATPREKLASVSHSTTEPAAQMLTRSNPLLAAKLQVAMAVRILEAKKSRYYDAALANLEKARSLLLKHGKAREWSALATELQTRHRHKRWFTASLQHLEEERPAAQPSFLERARKHWTE